MGRRARERRGERAGRRPFRPWLLPKLCGADVELGNYITGLETATDTCREASQALLREITGLPLVSKVHAVACRCRDCYTPPADTHSGRSRPHNGAVVYDPQDWGRKYLSGNGGCVYIDMNHLEICLPEVLSARDHLAAWHAMLRIARRALDAANARVPPGQRIHLLAANSDGFGHSYGSHLNFLVTRRAWDNLFCRKLHQLLFLAAYQVSSIIFTGQGKVGSENGAPAVDFQLSQRADFFETLTGEMTTHRRPIVNSRNETLCGDWRPESADHATVSEMARLHVIFYDSNLSHAACLLKVGVLQIVLAMIEAEWVRNDLALEDPVEALGRWSHDPTLEVTARTASGRYLTALQMQGRFLEQAKRFADAGGCDGIVPGHRDILDLWEDTLVKLEAGDLPALARRLDWALKLLVLRGAMDQRRDLTWSSPEIKYLDQMYGHLDPQRGLYWAYEAGDVVERLVSEERITALTEEPPEDTRAWTRAMLLRRARAEEVDDVNWDRIRFRAGVRDGRPAYRTVRLANPLGHTKQATEALFRRGGTRDGVLNGLGVPAQDEEPRAHTALIAYSDGLVGPVYHGPHTSEGWIYTGGHNGHEDT